MNIPPVFRLLVLSIIFTISLILFRIFYCGNLMYAFLVWNLLLASIPLVLSTRLVQLKAGTGRWALFILWLVFFPNALYIVTDLVHLKERYPIPLWFDIALIYSAANNGLLIAYASLRQVESFLKSQVRDRNTNFIVVGCLFLSSFGVYAGRFLRWNSWDVLINPLDLMSQIFHHVINPFQHTRTWEVTAVLTIFFSLFYFTMRKLPTVATKTSYNING